MRTVSAALCALALLGRVSLARATHEPQTITGEGKCAKCILNEGDTHPTVIQVKERDKTVNYYLAKNEAAKMVDKKFCEKPQKVTATGIVKEVKGKLELSATKVELVRMPGDLILRLALRDSGSRTMLGFGSGSRRFFSGVPHPHLLGVCCPNLFSQTA
jgi:hypothetical protein